MLHTLSRLKSYAVCASSTRYTPKNIVACWLDSLQRQSHQTRYSSTNTKVKDVAIIGGGISGLASAYYITKLYPSAKVTIYENSSRLGGWLQSTRHQVDEHGGTVLFESGPRTLRPGGNGLLSLHLLSDIGLENETIFTSKKSPAARNRFVHYPDHLVNLGVPYNISSWFQFIKTLISEQAFKGMISALITEPFMRKRPSILEDESVASFLGRRLSPELVDRLVSAGFHGIYAGNVYELSAKSLMKRIWLGERKHGSIIKALLSKSNKEASEKTRNQLISELDSISPISKSLEDQAKKSSVFTFRDGLGQFTDALCRHIRRDDRVCINTDTVIKSISKSNDKTLSIDMSSVQSESRQQPTKAAHSHVIWTAKPDLLREILPNSTSVSGSTTNIPYTTVMTVTIYYKSPNLHPPGFGYLIPLAVTAEQNPECALGVVFDTSYSPSADLADGSNFHGPVQDTVSKRGTKLTVMLGGHHWQNLTQFPSFSDGEEMARNLLKRHLNITEKPLKVAVNLQTSCIPQYVVGHQKRLDNIHRWLLDEYSGQLRVAGNWINGVGVNDCLKSAYDTVKGLDKDNLTGIEEALIDD